MKGNVKMKEIFEKAQSWLLQNGLLLLYALAIFVIGSVIVKILINVIERLLKRSKIDVTLHKFLLSASRIILLIILTIMSISVLPGVDVTSLVTLLGAAGLAVSLAVKDSLANLAGGLLVLISKPFAAGGFVGIDFVSGTVTEKGLIYTVLRTIDNKRIFVPNADVAKAKITNYSSEKQRRLDLVFYISYSDDMEKAKTIIRQVAEKSPYALKTPEPLIRVCAHAENSINIACRLWVDGNDYWNLYYDMLEDVKKEFDRNNITIPYRPLDIKR